MNTKKKILFRADGGPSIGLGHFVRTLGLAELLNADFNCIYVTQTPSEYQISEIEKVCHSYISLPNDDTHFKVFLNLLKGDEIVVLDNYFFDSDYHKKIKQKGCILVCIDDLYDKHYVADLIINHSPGLSQNIYELEDYTKLALGIKYALLRPMFYEAAKHDRTIIEIKKVLICLGGADPENITKNVLSVVTEIEAFTEINVILGSAYLHESTLSELLNKNSNIKVLRALNECEMMKVMSSVDLAIVSASGTLFEILATGAIPLICYYAENQKALFHYYKNKRAFETFDAKTFEDNEFKKTIDSIITNHTEFSGFKEREEIKDAPSRIKKLFKALG